MNKTDREAPKKLRTRWSKRERDFVFSYPGHKADGHLLSLAFFTGPILGGQTLAQELEQRGYDMKTLRFEITKKPGGAT